MQSHATQGLIAQNNYWVLSPHDDCFINNSRFKCSLHICFPKELCRGNNSLKLSLFLSCGTGRKGPRVGVTGGSRRGEQDLCPFSWGAMAPPRAWVWTWAGLPELMRQTFSFKVGMAKLRFSAKPASKGCWKWRGEAGFPIKGKGVYRCVCVCGSTKILASGLFCLLQKFKWIWQSVCCEGDYGGNRINVTEWEFKIVNVQWLCKWQTTDGVLLNVLAWLVKQADSIVKTNTRAFVQSNQYPFWPQFPMSGEENVLIEIQFMCLKWRRVLLCFLR